MMKSEAGEGGPGDPDIWSALGANENAIWQRMYKNPNCGVLGMAPWWLSAVEHVRSSHLSSIGMYVGTYSHVCVSVRGSQWVYALSFGASGPMHTCPRTFEEPTAHGARQAGAELLSYVYMY
jgi:hypothetical protein